MRFECLSGLKQRLQSGKNTGPSIGAGSVSGVIRSVRSLNFLRQSLVFPVVRNDAPIVQRRAESRCFAARKSDLPSPYRRFRSPDCFALAETLRVPFQRCPGTQENAARCVPKSPVGTAIVEPFFGAQIASKCVFTAPTSRSARRIADAARCLLTPEPKLAGCGKGVVF